jgi:hypothetical protein
MKRIALVSFAALAPNVGTSNGNYPRLMLCLRMIFNRLA